MLGDIARLLLIAFVVTGGLAILLELCVFVVFLFPRWSGPSDMDMYIVLGLLVLLWLRRSARARPAVEKTLRCLVNCLALVFWVNLPLGPEQRVVRRHPWVTYTVVGLCVAVFQLQLLTEPSPELRREFDRAWNEAVTYAVEHPHLEVPLILGPLAVNEIARRRREASEQKSPTTGATLAREQAELEEKSEVLFALRRQSGKYRWADVPARTTWWTRLTSDFVHSDWLHLVGNMLFLLAFGPYLEDVYGRGLFAALYLGSGAASSLATVAEYHGTYIFCLGASGAIAGVMGAFLVRFATRRLRVVNIPSIWLPMPRVNACVPAFGFLSTWLAWNVRGMWNGWTGVGYWAHIGGFVFGLVFAIALRLTRIEECVVNPGIEARISLHQHAAVEKSFALRMKGRCGSALNAAESALAEQPPTLSLLREAYDAAVARGRLDRAGTHATRLVGLLGTRSDPDDLRETLLFIVEARTTMGAALPARFYFAAGDCLERQGQVDEALRYYSGLANHPSMPIARRAAARRARLLKKLGRAFRGVVPHQPEAFDVCR